MPDSEGKSTINWETPLRMKQVVKLLFACSLGMWWMNVALMVSTAFCAGFAMTLFTMGGAPGIPPLPVEMALQTATFIWDDFSRLMGYRFLNLLMGFAGIAIPLLVCLSVWKRRVNLPSVFGPSGSFGVRHATIALATTFAIWSWQALAAGSLSHFAPLHYESKQVEILSMAQSNSPIGMLVMVLSCSLFPLLEEILFRGIAYRVFRSYWKVPVAVVASALLFGIWHLRPDRLWLFVHTTGIGVLLALSYEVTGSLWVPIAGHIFNNLLVFLNQSL